MQTETVKKAARVADVILGTALVATLAFEAYAIANRVPGDTISERTRHYFRVKGPVGSTVFLVTLGSVTTWYAAHIVERKV